MDALDDKEHAGNGEAAAGMLALGMGDFAHGQNTV